MYFATFGSSQLKDFDLRQPPMETLVTVEGAEEHELREALFNSPIGGAFCTTYPMEYLKEFPEGKLVELDELMKDWKHRQMSLKEMRGY